MKILTGLLIVLSGIGGYFVAEKMGHSTFEGTNVTPQDLIRAVNEDRKSITLVANSMVELIKKFNEVAPPEKRLPEYKKPE